MIDPDKLSTASSIGREEIRRPLLEAFVRERRILFFCTLAAGICSLVWLTAVCTENWCVIQGDSGIYIPESRRYFKFSTLGLWKTCRNFWEPPLTLKTTTTAVPHTNLTKAANVTEIMQNFTATLANVSNITAQAAQEVPGPPPSGALLKTKCTNYLSSDLETGRTKDPAYSIERAAYCRTMVSFAIIGFLVMCMGFGFSVYTFRNPRYMFKRLASGIHFISTSCSMVVVQILMTTIDFEKRKITYLYPQGAKHYFGSSFFLAWFVMFVNFSAFASFLWYSKKRKGDKAATEELAMADEPTIIGR